MCPDTGSESVKSRLFNTVANDPESANARALAQDIARLLSGIDDSMRNLCVAKLSEWRKTRTTGERDVLIESISPTDIEQRSKIESSLSVLSFLTSALLSDRIPDGDHSYWAGDLESLGWLNTNTKSVFESTLSSLIEKYLPDLRIIDRKRRTEAGVLPRFKSLGITVEARSVKKNPYRWGSLVKGKAPNPPEIIGAVMVASVSIGVDEGFPEDFYFQMDEKDIDNFVESLLAAKKEMGEFSKYLNLDSEGVIKGNG